jgi:hypothetical protein
MAVQTLALVVAAAGCAAAYYSWVRSQRLRRAEFIRIYRWPRGLLTKLGEKYPGVTRKEAALVSRGLRQFFIAHLMSGNKYVSMPSQIADDLWHEFILYTREYQEFCTRAFGSFLHHTPAAVLDPAKRVSNEGLRRVWWYVCKYENIDPRNPTRLPLLFALDAKLDVPNGFQYEADCRRSRDLGATGVYCGGDFGTAGVDGSMAGFGDNGWAGGEGGGDTGDGGGHGGDGGGDGGGGDGGGCGGGCGGD